MAAPERRAPGPVRPGYLLILAAIGVLIAVGSSLIASSGRVGSAERVVFHALNGLPDLLRWPMWAFQLLGLVALPLVVAVLAVIVRRFRLAVVAVVTVPLKLYLEKSLIKDLVERQRPGRT